MGLKLENYIRFFDDQIREAERDRKTVVKTSVGQLVLKDEVAAGWVDHVDIKRGHVVLRFPKDKGPRLKVPRQLTLIKKKSFADFGGKIGEWECSLLHFLAGQEYRSEVSDLLPLYYLRKDDPRYDYVGCSSVSLKLFDFIASCVKAGKNMAALVFAPIPPVDYFKNLNSYMERCPENPELQLEPKMDFKDWHPEELAYNPEREDEIARTILKTLEDKGECILQGPPGTGKSYTIAQIISHYLEQGKIVCATTMANKGLVELVKQEPLRWALEQGRISKTNLSADEKKQAPGLKSPALGLIVPEGELLCATNYILSGAHHPKNIELNGLPSYDLVVIEEASQAFLTAIIAFKSLGRKCLIVGDPMQLPPIVSNVNNSRYRTWNVNTQIEGLKTIALGSDIKSYRITTTFRLTPASAALTGMFYDNRFTSVQKTRLDYSKTPSAAFPPEGGVLYHCTDDSRNGVCSDAAMGLVEMVISMFRTAYTKRTIAVISPFKDTVKHLQKMFLTETTSNITIETIDRIQGMTVDYAILYLPGRNPGFALDERRFNVATSRSRSSTLIVTDVPLENFHTVSPRIKGFLGRCRRLDGGDFASVSCRIDRDEVKMLYPGLEHVVDVLMNAGIEFGYDGDVDLTDPNGVVIASAGMLLRNYMIAIDPVDEESAAIFTAAGYRVVKAVEFNLEMVAGAN